VFDDKSLGRHSIKFGGRGSKRDMGLILTDADIGSVQLKTVDVSIPYNNRPLSFDFSQICGEPIYQPRKLRFEFAMTAPSARIWQDRYRSVCTWLMRQPRGELYFDAIRGYHFTARCDKVGIEQMYNDHTGRISAEFTADPFMRSEDYADIAWDSFSFTNDCLNQDKILAAFNRRIEFYSFADKEIVPRLMLESMTDTSGLLGYVVLNGERISPIQHTVKQWFRQDGFVVLPGRNTLLVRGNAQLVIDLVEEVL